MEYNFKLGDRIEFPEQDGYDRETGVVVAVDGSIYSSLGNIWVKWDDSDGEVTSLSTDYIRKLTIQSKARPHAELIKAWADGAEIEYFDPTPIMWRPTGVPMWDPVKTYRIKPEEEQKIQEIKLVAFIDEQGSLRWVREDLFANTSCQYVRVPSEDKTITVEVVSK